MDLKYFKKVRTCYASSLSIDFLTQSTNQKNQEIQIIKNAVTEADSIKIKLINYY